MRIDVEISKLITDPQCQRERPPEAWIAELQQVLRSGQDFRDPIVVFEGRAGRMIVAAGNCRLEAARREGRDSIDADVREGELRDAILYSVASDVHGERRTTADKRKATETLLCDPVWATWSDREIASRVGCSPTTVGSIRRALIATVQSGQSETRTSKDGRQRPATQPPRPAKAGVEAETVKHAARHDDEHDDKSREEFTHAERPIAERHPVVATDTSPAAPARSAAFNHQGFVEPLRRLGSFIDERANAVGRRDREYHRALELWREMAAVLATWTGHDPTESDARRRMLAR